jgi:hypothetical protein
VKSILIKSAAMMHLYTSEYYFNYDVKIAQTQKLIMMKIKLRPNRFRLAYRQFDPLEAKSKINFLFSFLILIKQKLS